MSWGQRGNFNNDFASYHFLLYIKPWNRIGPYLIGILLGYYLAYKDNRNQKSTTFALMGWMLSLFAISWALFGAYPAIQVELLD
jgi:hypothetical protein